MIWNLAGIVCIMKHSRRASAGIYDFVRNLQKRIGIRDSNAACNERTCVGEEKYFYCEVLYKVDETIFDRWASLPDKAEAALLSAPFTFPPTPSMALCVFKSCLTEAGISSRILYPVFPLIRKIL